MELHITDAYGYALVSTGVNGRTAITIASVDGDEMRFKVLQWCDSEIEAYEILTIMDLVEQDEREREVNHDSNTGRSDAGDDA